MLTVKEREGLTAILQKLTARELISLACTTTKGLVRVNHNSTNENIHTILKFAENALDLLRRRKVKKEYIYQYLVHANIILPIASEKVECIKACLKHWQSPEDARELSLADTLDGEDTIMEDVEEESISSYTAVISSSQVENEKLKSMGQTFATWFYKLFKEGKAGSEHFWPDASLRLYAQDTQQDKYGLFSTSVEISRFFGSLVCDHHIFLDPNILASKCLCDLYGMVTVDVSGVIHRNATCIGLFDQQFGLVKDPQQDDKWKIKFTNLKMKINCTLLNQILLLHQLKNN